VTTKFKVKQVMSPALALMVGGTSELYAESGAMVKTAIALLGRSQAEPSAWTSTRSIGIKANNG